MATWSGIRSKLENECLCPALRGRIQYFATTYSKSADHVGRAAIRLDGREILRSSCQCYFEKVWSRYNSLRATSHRDHKQTTEALNLAHAHALDEGTFDQEVFYEAFWIYDNQSLELSLASDHPIVRIFALLDRRLGRRRLLALKDTMEQELSFVRAFYIMRMQAEGLIKDDTPLSDAPAPEPASASGTSGQPAAAAPSEAASVQSHALTDG